MDLSYDQAKKKLSKIEQEHLLFYWNVLNLTERHVLLTQIDQLDLVTFSLLQNQLLSPSISSSMLEPFNEAAEFNCTDDHLAGQKLLKEGKVGCIVTAGGQGTRLDFAGPKGLYPLTLIKHKTLFQLVAEKTRAASSQAGKALPLAIMTSAQNHQATLDYFTSRHFFGLDPTQVSFFSQGTLPYLTSQGNLFLEKMDRVAVAPDGNGSIFHHFVKASILERWKGAGIKYVLSIPIDNPLADPFDSNLIGFQARCQIDVTLKACKRLSIQEQVGILAKVNRHLTVVEYTEVTQAKNSSPSLDDLSAYPYANLSLFGFTLNAMEKIAAHYHDMPLHFSHKPAHCLKIVKDATMQDLSQSEQLLALKSERFIFDSLAYVNQSAALIYPRALCFAPLKNATGENSPLAVQQALRQQDRLALEKITGCPLPAEVVEISQDFYYPTTSLRAKWQGQTPHSAYVEAKVGE